MSDGTGIVEKAAPAVLETKPTLAPPIESKEGGPTATGPTAEQVLTGAEATENLTKTFGEMASAGDLNKQPFKPKVFDDGSVEAEVVDADEVPVELRTLDGQTVDEKPVKSIEQQDAEMKKEYLDAIIAEQNRVMQLIFAGKANEGAPFQVPTREEQSRIHADAMANLRRKYPDVMREFQEQYPEVDFIGQNPSSPEENTNQFRQPTEEELALAKEILGEEAEGDLDTSYKKLKEEEKKVEQDSELSADEKTEKQGKLKFLLKILILIIQLTKK